MRKKILGAILAWAFAFNANAVVITINEFTGDDAQMNVTILDAAPSGVTAEWTFTAGSANTGDITGVWLGITDSVFNPSSILASQVSVLSGLPAGTSYTVHIGSATDLQSIAPGVTLEGAAGFALLFDFDLALSQNESQGGGNDIITSLKVGMSTAGLTAAMFDAAGARLQSSTGPEGSSKLAGGITVNVAEPTTLALLGAGLLLAGGFASRRKPQIGRRNV